MVGVKYLQWNFSAGQQNGGVGYTELAAYGPPSPAVAPAALGAMVLPGRSNFVMVALGLSVGQSYVLQSTTNLENAVWQTETNFTAMQGGATFTNAITNSGQKFYRLVGNY